MSCGANPDVPVIMDIPADAVQMAKARLQGAWDYPYTPSQPRPAVVLYPRDDIEPECSIEERIHDAEVDFRYQMAWAKWDLACLRDAGLAGMVLDRIGYYSKRTGGSIPIRLTDTQSPMDIAVQIIKDEHVLLGMYDNPDALHALLRTVTAALVQFVLLQESRAANFFGYTHQGIWRHRGIYVSDDMAAVVSPAFYHEFFVPHNQLVSAQFGGISIHCCRRYQQNLEEIARMDGFMSFDADACHNDPDAIAHALTADTKCCRPRGIWHAWADNADEAVEKALFAAGHGIGLILTVKCSTVTEGTQAVAAVEHAAAQG